MTIIAKVRSPITMTNHMMKNGQGGKANALDNDLKLTSIAPTKGE